MPHRSGRRRPERTTPRGALFRPLGFVAALVLGTLALPAAPLHAAMVRVPADQPTVRAAASAAANGDTVLIAPGIHGGGVYLTGKRLTFASWFLTTQDTSFISQTVLDSIVGDPCGGSTSCAGNVVLEFAGDAGGSAVIGLTLRRGEDGVRSRAPVDIAWCHIVANADGIDYQNNSGGTIQHCLFANNSDDGIDINGAVNLTVRDNIIRNNHQDGVEFRLYAYAGPMTYIDFLRNRFVDNGGDGIQLIDYPDASDRTIRIEYNYFTGTLDAAVGCMPDGMTSEDFSGAPIAERIHLVGNTFSGNRYGFVGGANVIALNNIFTGTQASALRRTGGNSIASYNLFWNNGVDHEESVVDPAHLLSADPQLDPTGRPGGTSPAIDAGTAFFQWQGQTVLDLPPSAFTGSAPDLGAYEFATAPGANAAPVVNAGPDQTVTLPGAAALDGTLIDDGLPYPPTLTSQWSVASGPGPVTFLNANAVDTQASFTIPGVYVLALTAGDGALSASDAVQITVQTPPAGSGTFERRIAAGSDDAEQSASGGMDLGSSDIEMTLDGSNQTVGLRFTNVVLAPGATITAAWIQFEADETHSDPTTLLIQGHAADHAAAFTTAASNLSSRPRTGASATWSPVAWTLVGEAGTKQRTPDLRSVIQEIVSRPGWTSGNALALVITGTGRRTARAFEGKAAGAALLHVEYGGGPPPPPPGNTAPVVDAGPDRTITLPAEAILDGTVSDDGLPGPPALTVAWSASGPGPVSFLDPAAVDTRASFTVPGSYVLRLGASDGALGTTDSLRVTVLPAPPPGAGTVDRRIAAGSDDAEESAAAKVSTNNSDIELVFDRTNQRVGLRFTALAIPPGATVTHAYVQFTADETQNEATSLLIQGQAADNPGTFTSAAGNVSTRPRTAASVAWAPPAWAAVGEAGANQRTPELTGVIQEIVSRPGWASGNALVLIVTGTGHRTAESFEGKAAAAALLHVEYTVGITPAAATAEASPESGTGGEPAPETRVTGAGARGELALHALVPNPTHGPLRVELSLPAGGGRAVLEMVDVAGRRVMSRDLGALEAGRHVVDVGESLPAGVYLVRLIQGSRARVMKAVVIR